MKTWAVRLKEYKRKLGSKSGACEVLVEIKDLEKIKILSYGERRIKNAALDIINAKEYGHLYYIQGGRR